MIVHMNVRSAVLTVLVMVAMIGVGFVVTRSLTGDGSPATAGGPETAREPLWYVPLLDEFQSASRAERVVNGIRVGDDSIPRLGEPCDEARAWDGEAAFGSEIDPRPAYLPAGTVPANVAPEGMTCGGVPYWSEITYFVPGGSKYGGRFGGDLSVFRFRGAPQFALDYPTERIENVEVAGRAAAMSPPLTEDGFGPSAVLIREPWGLTVIRADGITVDELLRVAGSLRTPQ